ncbi:hypothetical protein [Stella sp.]|uniref:hypothetical protein n=1 Tax=Stella sp. TaxID=2912054 RepID=UPI0035B21EBA
MATGRRPPPILRGANWFADGDALLWPVRGEPPTPAAWDAAVAGLDRILPPGLPAGGLPAPQDRAEATEFLAAAICRWAGLRPVPIARSTLAAERRNVAALWPGFPPLTRHAFELAEALLAPDGTRPDRDADRRAALQAIRRDSDGWLRSSRRYLCAAAARRGLPFLMRTPGGGVSQIGEGRHLQLFDATATDRTPWPRVQVAGNKRLGNAILRQAGIPVARQRAVPDLAAARRALDELGLPLVVKPEDGRRQAGVGFVFRAEDLEAVWTASREVSPDLLAESYIPGVEHRVLVADGRIVHAVAGEPASVVGDGRTTVARLIAAVNAGRDRGAREDGFRLSPIPTDALARRHLASQGLSPDDVPAAGRRVEVHPLPMLRFGAGWKTDVTDRIHPETARMVLRAVAVLGLDIAGVDLRTPDIGRSWKEVGAGLCEVNPQPSLTVHYNFAEPPDPGVADRLLEMRFPPGRPFRMTHVAVLAEDGGWSAAEHIAARLRRDRGWRVAIAAAGRVELDGWDVPDPGQRPFERYAAVATDPTLDATVHVLDPDEIERFGLGTRHIDHAHVTALRLPPLQAARVRQVLETAGAAIHRLGDPVRA